MAPEHEQPQNWTRLSSSELAPRVAALLAAAPLACVTHLMHQGAVYLIKAPEIEIDRARGTVPMYIRHQLFGYPTAPVIRTVLTLYDYPSRPLSFESFLDIAEQDQRAAFAAPVGQDHHRVLFYDEQLQHRLSKQIPAGLDNSVPDILARAERLRAAIPPQLYDFDRAKAAVKEDART